MYTAVDCVNDTATTESYPYGHTLSLHDALPFSALDEEREGRTGAGAVAVENILLTRIGDEAEIAEPLDLGMVAKEGADLQRILARAVHAQFERFEAAEQHPCGIGVADRAERVAHRPDDVEQLLVARDRQSTRLHSRHTF